MSVGGPEFNNRERPAYELPTLLARLGQPGAGQPLTEEQANVARAIKQHAYNAGEAILDSIESIGSLMVTAALNEEHEIDRHHVAKIGMLLNHLAVELQALHDTESDMRAMLKQAADAGRALAAGTGKPGRGLT